MGSSGASATAPSDGRFQLQLRVQGRTVMLDASGRTTVEQLTHAVFARTGLPPCCFGLYAASKPLLQGTLEVHGLFEGILLQGGMPNNPLEDPQA